jgi:hypothetical protein
MSMKNSSDTIGKRSRNLPVCIAVPQPLRHRVPQKKNKRKLKETVEINNKRSNKSKDMEAKIKPN